MRGKPGISKSIRFPESEYHFVNSLPGDNFSDKLSSLIISYRDDIPKRQQEICRLEIAIQERGKQLEDMGKKIDSLDNVLREIFWMQPTYDRIRQNVQDIMAQFPAKPKTPGG